MANKYHDEEGKFASRDVMTSAIARLSGEGDFEGALKIQQELASFDREEAAKVAAFYKTTAETVASSYGYTSNQSGYGKTPMRDFVAPLAAAQTPDQIREVIQLAGEGNFNTADNLVAAWNSPGADAKLRAELLDYTNGWGSVHGAIQDQVNELTPAQADAIARELKPSDTARNAAILRSMSPAYARELARQNRELIPVHARHRDYDPAMRDDFINYAKPDKDKEYNVFADEVAYKVAHDDPSQAAFNFALAHGDYARQGAALNSQINVRRAQDLVTAQSFDGFASLKKALKENKQTPLVVLQALDATPVPLGEEAGAARLAQIAAWKEEGAKLERERDWIGSGRAYAKARRALTKTDAAPVAFAQLSKRWDNSQANYAKGTGGKPSKAYLANKERYENAVEYQQTHAAKSAVERLAGAHLFSYIPDANDINGIEQARETQRQRVADKVNGRGA